MAGIEESQFRVFDLDGERVNVPVRKAAEFTAANPSAQELRRYRAPGMDEDFWVRDGQTPPDGAERVYRFRSEDGVVNVPRGKLGGYIGSRATPDKDRSWGSYAGEAYADAGRAVAEGARKVAGAVSGAAEVAKDAGKAVGQAVGTVASNAADVARRIPAAAEGFLDRAAVAPVLLAGRVADALNPDPLAGPVDVLTGQRGRFSPQEMGYEEDPYLQGLASRTADRARAWLARRDEARAPTTPAGRVADVPVQFGTTLVGYSTPVGPLAMVGNAAQAGDRAYAEGASGAQALGRTALSLGAQAAAFGPKPLPIPGANAAGRAVEGAAARIGGRLAQTPEGAARAVRTAVTAGQVARGAVESGARMAGVTAAEGGDAKDVLIAAGVGGAVGGALRGLSTRPLARVAGEGAERVTRGGVDTPPPRMDPAGLAANRAEATARTPEGDAALARANAGLASPERAGLPAPAEPGAVPTVYGQRTIVPPYYGPTVSRPGEPITPPAPYADKVPEPIPETREEVVRRRKEALDALSLPQRLKKTGFSAYYDQFPERAGVLDAIGFENFAKLYRKYKGDFRNVTGDLVNASEVGGIVGRDYSGADGVRRALEDAAQEYAGYREWKEQGAPTAEEEMQTGQEIAWNKQQNAEAEAEVRRRYELAHPEMTGEPRVTEEEIRAAQAAAEQGEVERIEAEAMQEPEPEPAPAPAPAPVAESSTPPQSANISRRYTAKPLVFQKPIVGPSGARIVSYNWMNKPVEYVDERGEDRVKRVSDWDYSNENEDTGRQIVHSFVVEMPDGTSRAVSAESAAKALGYPVGKFKTEALREIRQAMLVDSLPAEQVAGFVEALGRSTRDGARNAYPIYKQTDKVSILKDGTIRIVGNRKADGIADRWPVVITTVSPDGTIKTERLNAWPTTKGKAISADAIAKRAQAPAPVAESPAPPREATIAEKAQAVPWDTRDFFSWTANAFHTPEEANEVFGKVIEEMAKREISYAKAAAEVTNYTRYKTDALADRITDLAKAGIQIHQLVEEARAKLPPKEPDTVRQGWNAELYRLSDAKAELDRYKPGGREYKAHLRRYERQTEDILDRMAELSPALKDVLTARRALEQALDSAEKKKDADEEWRAINDLVERARHYQQKAISKGPGITFEEIEEPGYPLPGRGKAAELEPFALDGGTPAEIDAEKARAAEAQKRAAMEEAAAAPGRDLGTVTIQEGLPGLGGDGTLFTPPAGGWSGRVASGPVRGDVAAETPRLAGAPEARGVKPATPDGPRAAIRSELQVLLDSGEKDPATLEDLARRAEAADAFETAALARQAAGTYKGTPWGTEGGSWPAEEPPAARATVGDLVQLVKSMGDGSAPAVMRRIARHPNWAGVFRGEQGAPESGRIGIITKMARLVDDSQKARIREQAARKAAETGEDPATVYASMMVRAIRENAAAGPKPLQAVLAHEIGHFLDFLDEGTLKRGNVLGHLAALKKYMARTLFPTKAAADAAGAPGITAAEAKAAAKEWKVPESEARRRLVEERDLLTHPEIRREMESLVAWFRQTDGAPDYFRNDPAELYAEAFSAWVNYPAETERRAPEFAAALEGWMDARPEAARALEEFRSGVTQRAARAAVERGDTTDPAFFAAQEREAEAARWWQRRKAAAAANLRPQTARQRVKAFGDALRVSLTGPLNVIRSDLMASGAGQAFRPENLPLWRAMRQAENAPNLAALWDYRFKAFVEPELEGAPYTAFLNYLKHYRIATELLGRDLDRGRMNLPNPGGATPGDITRDGVNQATSSAAWIHALQRDQPELYAKLERARKAFWEKVRNGRDDLGGDGSPMQVVRDTHVLSKEQKEQILGNEGYVSFSEKDLPDPSRRMSSEEQILWDGILSQRTGTFKEPGDVVANTIRGDYNLTRRLNQMELALQTVDWLRANKPWLVGGQAETKMDPATGRLYVEQGTKPGMRTVSFLRDGKPEGWYVPVAYAEAVEMPGRGERSWDGIMGALSKVKRGLNAMQTSWNPVFNINNSWAKDPHSLALRLPNWRARGHGLLGGTARALGNVFGHYGEQLASYLDNSGRDYARGKYNPDTARALAWGAVNNAAPGSTAYADAQGGGVGVLEGRLRDRGLEGQTLDDAARRQIIKARGLTEEQIDAGLRSAEGTLEKWAKAWDSMGSVARGARLLYPRILSQLQHGEIRTKSYALKRILAERPDLSREEAVEIARQQIGTPDMANKPAIDRSPLLGATLFQYFTPRVHGWVDQLVGAMRRGWTGGTREQATKFTRLVALTAAMSVPFFILRDAIQTYRHAEEEEGKARARGDLAAAERFAEEKEKARARARSIQSISSRDLFTKVFAFAGDGRALGFSVDPTVTPITTAVLGSLFGRDWGVKPGDALREGVGTEILPGFAPLFTAAWGNLRGFDPNTGRPIGGGEDADLLDRLSWTAETLTGRALGTGAFSYARELAAPKDDARSEERRSRQDVPILSAAWRPFWRKTGYGLVERAVAMREEQKQVNALVGAIAERYARGQPVSEEDARWFAQHAAQPGESVRAAAERVWKLRNMTPDQRAVDSLSRRSRREIEEEFGYIPPPPRLTDEDRAR